MQKSYRLNGLDCANCAAKLENKIKKVDGVKDAAINFFSSKMTLCFDDEDAVTAKQEVLKTVKKTEPDVKVEAL